MASTKAPMSPGIMHMGSVRACAVPLSNACAVPNQQGANPRARLVNYEAPDSPVPFINPLCVIEGYPTLHNSPIRLLCVFCSQHCSALPSFPHKMRQKAAKSVPAVCVPAMVLRHRA